MPSGRLSVRGGVLVRPLRRGRDGVGVRGLLGYRSAVDAPISFCDALSMERRIRWAVRIYASAHRNGIQTPTNRRAELARIRDEARRFLVDPASLDGSERLEAAIEEASAGTIAAMHKAGLPIQRLRGGVHAGLEQEVRLLAMFDPTRLAPKGKWPDPPLADLVLCLMPIWLAATGSIPYPRNLREGDKAFPFGIWVEFLIRQAGLPEPPEHRILAVVRQFWTVEKPQNA
jgi:hypothetical protein